MERPNNNHAGTNTSHRRSNLQSDHSTLGSMSEVKRNNPKLGSSIADTCRQPLLDQSNNGGIDQGIFRDSKMPYGAWTMIDRLRGRRYRVDPGRPPTSQLLRSSLSLLFYFYFSLCRSHGALHQARERRHGWPFLSSPVER